jgi:hypothetical protein
MLFVPTQKINYMKSYYFSVIVLLLIIFATQYRSYAQTTEQRTSDKVTDVLSAEKPEVFNLRFLALEKQGRIKRVRFYIGDEIHIKLKGDHTKYSPIITALGKDYVETFGTKIPLKEIQSITVFKDDWLVHQGSYFLPIAGAGYFVMDMVNPLFSGNSNREAFSIDRRTVITSSVLMLTGFALNLFKKRTFRLHERRYLKVMYKF